MQQYSTAEHALASPASRPRLKVIGHFAAQRLADDHLTILPTNGALAEVPIDEVTMAYLQVTHAERFEPLPHSMLCQDGWQTLLGSGRAQLVHCLRGLAQIHWRDGSFQEYLGLRQEEMAKLVGVHKKTIQRWLAPGPELAVAISDYKKACAGAVDPVTGRRRKVSRTAIRNALLRLFITDIAHTCYQTKTGHVRNWVNRYRINPVDPLLPQQEEAFFTALGFALSGEGEEQGEVVRPNAVGRDQVRDQVRQRSVLRPSRRDHMTRLRHMIQDLRTHLMRRQNAPRTAGFLRADAETFWDCREKESVFQTEASSSDAPSATDPLLLKSGANGSREGSKISKATNDQHPLEPTSAKRLLSPGHNKGAPESHPSACTTNFYKSWCLANAQEIASYRRIATRYLNSYRWLNDEHPPSTATRVARLLCGAELPEAEIGAVLERARAALWKRPGSHLVRQRDGHFCYTPRYLRILQEILGGEANPAYLPATRTQRHVR